MKLQGRVLTLLDGKHCSCGRRQCELGITGHPSQYVRWISIVSAYGPLAAGVGCVEWNAEVLGGNALPSTSSEAWSTYIGRVQEAAMTHYVCQCSHVRGIYLWEVWM